MLEQCRSLLSAARLVNFGAFTNGGVNFVEGLVRARKPLSYPITLDIVLTKACNLRCIFCVSYGSLTGERWMPFSLYERIAHELFPKVHGIQICSGGEPFLYPRIRDALRLAIELRCMTTMTSNGMLLGQQAAEWTVSDQSLHELCISFDGATPETLERIRVGAKYERILSNIEYLSALKKRRRMPYPRLWFRYVVMRSNAEELPLMFDICAKYGLYRVDVVYLNVCNDIDFNESLFNHQQLAAEVFAEASRRAKERGIQLRLPALPGEDEPVKTCRYPWQFCQIDTDGYIRICYRSWRQRLGFFHDGFQSIWHGEHYKKIRRTVNTASPYYPYCRYCGDRLGCNWESAHNQQLHSDLYLIPGLEELQVPFNTRAEENISSLRDAKRQKTEAQAGAPSQ